LEFAAENLHQSTIDHRREPSKASGGGKNKIQSRGRIFRNYLKFWVGNTIFMGKSYLIL